ncbi:hypothetical protein TWF281_003724 [Arthrobotrys megalospora]
MFLPLWLELLLLGMSSFCNADQFTPFSEFLRHIRGATYRNHVSTLVADERAFLEIQKHILNMYGGVVSPAKVHSYFSSYGYTDCIPFSEQPTFYLLNLTDEEKTPPPVDEDADLPDLGSRTDGVKGQPVAVSLLRDPQAVDIFGNAQHCPEGTVPQSRLTLERINRYGTLSNFFRKIPLFNSTLRDATDIHNGTSTRKREVTREATRHEDGFKHLHEVGRIVQGAGFVGAGSAMNVWNPNAGFSISQMWLVNKDGKQTIEAGWYVWGHGKPKPFVYYTTSGEGTGCYNEDCPGFARPPMGGYPLDWEQELTPSRLGGWQSELRLAWKLVESKWCLYYQTSNPFRNHLVGWYPVSLFGTAEGKLGKNAFRVDFGGEVADNEARDRYGEMGSGIKVPGRGRAGYRQTAYQRNIQIKRDLQRDASEIWAPPFLFSPEDETAERCYNQFIDPGITVPTAGWGRYMFFGGPGGRHCDRETFTCPPECPTSCIILHLCPNDPRCLGPRIDLEPACCPSRAAEENAFCRRQREFCRERDCD